MPACGEGNEDEVGAKENGIINVQLLSLPWKGLGAVPDAFGGIAADYLCNMLLNTKLWLCAPLCNHCMEDVLINCKTYLQCCICKRDLLENLRLYKNNSSTCYLFRLLQFVCV